MLAELIEFLTSSPSPKNLWVYKISLCCIVDIILPLDCQCSLWMPPELNILAPMNRLDLFVEERSKILSDFLHRLVTWQNNIKSIFQLQFLMHRLYLIWYPLLPIRPKIMTWDLIRFPLWLLYIWWPIAKVPKSL